MVDLRRVKMVGSFNVFDGIIDRVVEVVVVDFIKV